MRSLLLLLFSCCLFGKSEAPDRMWIFEGDAHGVHAAGYLKMIDGGVPFGQMWFSGTVHGTVRLAGLGGSSYAQDRGGYSTCFYAAEDPWRLGEINWEQHQGMIDFYDVRFDSRRGEIPVLVRSY